MMYKVDLKTLKEVTKILDAIVGGDLDSETFEKIEQKSKKLSKRIKDNYTEIKP